MRYYILLILCLIIYGARAMDNKHEASSGSKVVLETSDNKELSANDALKISATIKRMLEDIRLSGITDKQLIIPLSEVPLEALEQIVPLMQHIEQRNTESIDTALKKFSLAQLISVIKTANYLDIPQIMEAAFKIFVVKSSANPKDLETYISKNILPADLARHMLHTAGIDSYYLYRLLPDKKDCAKKFDLGVAHDCRHITLSSDGKLIAMTALAEKSQGEDHDQEQRSCNQIWIKDVQTGNTNTLNAHTGGICTLHFSPNNKILASSAIDKKIILWDLETRSVLHTLVYDGHQPFTFRLFFSPNSKFVSVYSWNRKGLLLWNAETGEVIYEEPVKRCTAACFSSDSSMLIVRTDSDMYLRDIKNQKEYSLDCSWMNARPNIIASSHNGQLIAMGLFRPDDSMYDLRIWDVNAGKFIDVPSVKMRLTTSLCFSDDCSLLAVGSNNLFDRSTAEISIINVKEKTIINNFKAADCCNDQRVLFFIANDDSLLAAPISADQMGLWDSCKGTLIYKFDCAMTEAKMAEPCLISKGLLLTAADDRTAHVYNLFDKDLQRYISQDLTADQCLLLLAVCNSAKQHKKFAMCNHSKFRAAYESLKNEKLKNFIKDSINTECSRLCSIKHPSTTTKITGAIAALGIGAAAYYWKGKHK